MPTLGSTPLTTQFHTRSISQTAQYIQEKWTREIQQPFNKVLQAKKLVQDRSGLIADGGDVLNIPFAGTVNARAKAAATGLTYDSPEGTPVTINIDKHYYVGVMIEDIAKVQGSYDLKSAFQERMSEALARQIDTDLMGLYTAAGTTVAGGANITDANILAIVTAFDVSDTPMEGRRGLIGANTKADLLGINKYTAYDQTGKTGAAVGDGDNSGLVGSLYGMDVYYSGNVALATTGRNIFFHKKALTMAQQLAPKFEMEYSVDYLGTKCALHAVYGVGVERPASFIQLTRPTAA